MNLKKLLFWQTETNQTTLNEQDTIDTSSLRPDDALSNVIRLPNSNPLTSPAGLGDAENEESTAIKEQLGLMDLPEIKLFFSKNHFGLGRHNGANFKTQTALVLGKQTIISEFQNVLVELYERKKAKKNKLQLMALQINGYCEVTSSMVEDAKSNVERDMNILQDQISYANEGKGWVLQALNTYQIGFGKGVGEAVDFELNGQ
jgi:hypothetical protein